MRLSVYISCWLDLGGQLGVAGRREASAQVFQDVQGQAADQRDDSHLPNERKCGDEVHICGWMRGSEE